MPVLMIGLAIDSRQQTCMPEVFETVRPLSIQRIVFAAAAADLQRGRCAGFLLTSHFVILQLSSDQSSFEISLLLLLDAFPHDRQYAYRTVYGVVGPPPSGSTVDHVAHQSQHGLLEED